ncbi:hypothetical protein WJX84_006739 [Apatococcus fuscideae]|uniref:Peptidase A2 domain-containing protein n=1 Tax=Apatococcus fuscideae TaxID=2026836 RepID=A0AAW1STL0_9CHLO
MQNMHGRVQAVISSRAVPSREKGGFCSRAGGRKGGGASQAGKWDKRSSTWVVHIWLRNDSVDPPVYLQVPAVLDTGAENAIVSDKARCSKTPAGRGRSRDP